MSSVIDKPAKSAGVEALLYISIQSLNSPNSSAMVFVFDAITSLIYKSEMTGAESLSRMLKVAVEFNPTCI